MSSSSNRGSSGRGRGGSRGRGSSHHQQQQYQNKYSATATTAAASTPTSVLSADLIALLNQRIVLDLGGGRKISGLLKVVDPLVNVVLDEVQELNGLKRSLGLVIVRGPTLLNALPEKSLIEIENPFSSE